ncbi:Cardiolipin-specific deacylase [Seminavis robusta]|uniref:Cardiolipin-specific deacylase n=1 Tax=Seminavis robusta TaxID=568900 RepID=A0A9N8DQ75_9STRA|nr:Cardiolipin-specific deacylase [Seminavis robusta]|eukprot:Sro293_g110010.1 Cardiolipin-specific deacylase (390) ;mRNA; f:58098-59267
MIVRALRQWWTGTNDKQLFDAQERLLKTFVRAPLVSVAKRHGMNVAEFTNDRSSGTPTATEPPTVVLLHGYGSGLGFFFRNIDPLLDSGRVGRVLLVDWLGMGGSDRPYCRRPIRGLSDCTTAWCQSRFNPSQAVDFFLDPLHQLFQEEIGENESTWLVGHSLGGYLVARYALQHSTAGNSAGSTINMEKVILASPVGFPSKPTNLLPSAQMPTAIRLVDALWSANVTPQQLVRMMGATRGRNAVRRALAGRIPQLAAGDSDDHVLEILANYLFHITAAHPSGEFAINSLLEPGMSPDIAGVFAREPLEPLFQEYAQRQHTRQESKLHWKVLYGDHDWMRPNEPSARKALSYLSQQSNSNDVASISIVPNAGHHLYLDNAESFARHILQ